MKAFYLSKTFWVNIIMGVLPFVSAGIHETVKENPELAMSAVTLINLLLRAISKEKLKLF